MGKSVKNFEQRVYDHLKSDGFDVLRSGYPDFMVRRNGRYSGVCAVEVKQGSDKVRPNQKIMHDMFKDAGIPVYVIKPEDLYGEDNTNIRNPKPPVSVNIIIVHIVTVNVPINGNQDNSFIIILILAEAVESNHYI